MKEPRKNGTLNNKQANSLDQTISAAHDAANNGDFATALGSMTQFDTEIKALHTAGVLDDDDYGGLSGASSILELRLQPPFTANITM